MLTNSYDYNTDILVIFRSHTDTQDTRRTSLVEDQTIYFSED